MKSVYNKDELILVTILNNFFSCILYWYLSSSIIPDMFTFIDSIEESLYVLFGGFIAISGKIWTRFYLIYKKIKNKN